MLAVFDGHGDVVVAILAHSVLTVVTVVAYSGVSQTTLPPHEQRFVHHPA